MGGEKKRASERESDLIEEGRGEQIKAERGGERRSDGRLGRGRRRGRKREKDLMEERGRWEKAREIKWGRGEETRRGDGSCLCLCLDFRARVSLLCLPKSCFSSFACYLMYCVQVRASLPVG